MGVRGIYGVYSNFIKKKFIFYIYGIQRKNVIKKVNFILEI